MIRRMEDITGIDAQTIPMDDKGVMGLFHGTETLGITPEGIDGDTAWITWSTGIWDRLCNPDASGYASTEFF